MFLLFTFLICRGYPSQLRSGGHVGFEEEDIDGVQRSGGAGIRGGLGGLGSGGAGSTPFNSSRLDYNNRDDQLHFGHRLFDDGRGATVGVGGGGFDAPTPSADSRSSLLRNNTQINGELAAVNRPVVGRRASPNSDFRNPASEVIKNKLLLCY